MLTAGLFAMKTNALISFVGSLGALAVMTVIAVGIGQIFHNIPDLGPLKGIHIFLFFIFSSNFFCTRLAEPLSSVCVA
jgi:putative Ca2+/H+ antiporter (TMEM165/GDT1 family)